MAAERLSMRTIKEVLRLKWEKRFSNKQVSQSCNIARSTVRDYIARAERVGLSWPLAVDLDDNRLEDLLFPPATAEFADHRGPLDMAYIHKELARKSVTLRLLWLEYKASNPEGYQYSQYCFHYHQWRDKLDVSLRQNHRAGEKLFVDYAGQTIPVTDPETGKTQDAYLFLATLGASSYTFAWASLSQELPLWIEANVRALTFFGGVPEIIVPDNLKTGVTKPDYYEPEINPTYHHMACHYGTVIIPARAYKPKDKAKVESAVLVAERWIIAALRNHTFFSIEELNRDIADKLQELNNRKFQKLDGSRRSLYENIDRPALKPLPSVPYQYAECRKVRVNIDYHIDIESHYYSVPYQLVKEQVEAWITTTTVEVLFKNRRVASHPRSYEKYKHTTLAEHMPKAHQKYLEWTPSRIINWAGQNGPNTRDLVTGIMESRRHPEQGFRSCLGIMRLVKRYSPERVEAACGRALILKAHSYKSVESILKTNLDKQEIEASAQGKTIIHYNLRGREYYRQKEAAHA
ncbi:MAG: Integrase core domain protein [Candidatus Hydrogenedentes bacterium ADurb.Bin179]|nr:MAG: Integrase core domain protein [Candidatus Hydrogenedentes bacterium ADurb.Bin179]